MVFHEITKDAIQDAQGQHPRARHRARRRAGDPPHPRPPLRLRGLAGALAQGRSRPLGRSRAVGGDPPRRRPRARAARLRLGRVLGPDRRRFAPEASGSSFEAKLVRLGGERVASGRDFDDLGKLKGDAVVLDEPTVARARRRAARRRRAPHRHQARDQAVLAPPGGAVHDVDAAAGGRPQAAPLGPRHDERRAVAVRERLHHLYAHRLACRCRSRRSTRPAPRRPSSTAPTRSPTSRASTPASRRTRRRRTRRSARRARCSARRPSCRASLRGNEFKLYDLIWKRTVASQMADAKGQTATVTIEVGPTRSDAPRARGRHRARREHDRRVHGERHRHHLPRLPRRLRRGTRRGAQRRRRVGRGEAAAAQGGPGRSGSTSSRRRATRPARCRATPRRAS